MNDVPDRPAGFFREGGKIKPRHEKKGINETDLKISEHGAGEKIEVKIDPSKKPEIKQKEVQFISQEPVVGKIKNSHYQNKSQDVTLDIELKHGDREKLGVDGKIYENPLQFSITGGIWNLIHSDITSGGQIEDDLEEALVKHDFVPVYPLDYQEMRKLLDVWKKWHLNDTKAGTEKQEKIIDEHMDDQKYAHLDKFYDRKIEILKDNNLVVDNGIVFGKNWYYQPLPDDVVKFVREIQEKLKVNENGRKKD